MAPKDSSTPMISRLLQSYLRAGDHPAKGRIVSWLGRWLIPPAGLEVHLPDGLVFYLHPRDSIEHILLRGERYEPLTIELLRANLRPGDGAVLAGTNFGLHVAVCAQVVGPAGKVVGVEPQPEAILRTRLNLERNRLTSRVDLLQAAIGERPEILPMAWSKKENPGAASLLDPGEGFRVPAVRMEGAIRLLQERRFRVLLLDVQGYELHALAGADLTGEGPDLAIVEFDPEFLHRSGTSPEMIADLLVRSGYQLFDLFGQEVSNFDLPLPERNLVAKRREAQVVWPKSADQP